jgi:nucleoside-diphosphate-sugar epimerase
VSRHVVFGTGQVGRLVVEHLVRRGDEVVAVNRAGRGHIAGARLVGGDASDPEFTRRAASGADVVYFCLNAAHYERWAQEFPPLQRAVLAAAAAHGARLVVLENLYAYGPTGGADLVETLRARPTSAKAATRAAMTDELLDAHRAGRVEVAIGRASDFFGPGTTYSALGDGVFGAALTGRRAQVTGRPDQPHSYSYTPDVAAGYTPDVAAGLATLGTHEDAVGQIWHLPVAETRTTRQVVERVYRARRAPPAPARGGPHNAAADRRHEPGRARVPAHALPVHRALGRRRHQVPHGLRRPQHAARRRPRHDPPVVPRPRGWMRATGTPRVSRHAPATSGDRNGVRFTWGTAGWPDRVLRDNHCGWRSCSAW